MTDDPDAGDSGQRTVARGRHPAVRWSSGGILLVGLAPLIVDAHGVVIVALLFALSYLVWWDALERASPTPGLSRGRRVAACVLATSMVTICHVTTVVAVGDAIQGGPKSRTYLALATLWIAGGAALSYLWMWRTLADAPRLAGARRLLRVITGAAAVAVGLDALAFAATKDRTTMFASLLSLAAMFGAASILGWTVLPWLRLWYLGARTPSAK